MIIHFPPQLSDRAEEHYRNYLIDWALSNGLCMKSDEPFGTVHAPITLFPTPFSKSGFEEALEIQETFNEIYHGVVRNEKWLLDSLLEASKHDEFTKRLIDTHNKVKPIRTQPLTGGIFRSDYIVNRARTNDEGRQIKQVEFNTVSVSFGALATKASDMHGSLSHATRDLGLHGMIPHNPALEEIAKGISIMHNAYHSADEDKERRSVSTVVFIVQPDEKNVMDQRLLEFELSSKHNIVCYRIKFGDVKRLMTINSDNKLIFTPVGREVSVVYYRTGYSPNDYVSEAEWESRVLLESSHAIQCPSVLTQLAGAKLVQQLLSAPGNLEKVAPKTSQEMLARVRKTFVKMYPLDDSELGREGQRLALEEPDYYVLKPQREGGGNNIYGEDIAPFLQSIPMKSWSAYILMELIDAPKITNKILRKGEVISGRVINELGIFGSVLWNFETGASVSNRQSGWLLRTKPLEAKEGGVAAGFAAIDAIQLTGPRHSQK